MYVVISCSVRLLKCKLNLIVWYLDNTILTKTKQKNAEVALIVFVMLTFLHIY